MNNNSLRLRLIFITLNFFLLTACAYKPVPFEIATQNLSKDLLGQIQGKNLFSNANPAKKIVMDDFTDENSGETIKVSKTIEDAIFAEATNNFKNFSLSKLNSKNIVYADYIINGIITFEKIKNNSKKKYYHVFASATDKETGKVVAKSSAWILGTDLDYTPTKEYKSSPMFMNDNRHKSKVQMARGYEVSNNEYYKSIETNAILSEASQQFGLKKYRNALTLYQQAESKSDGKTMKTYAGLYQSNLKLRRYTAAGDAFAQLLEISVKDNNNLSVKFLFKVNSTDFIANKQLMSRYTMWLEKISHFLKYNHYCTQIIGHSSKSGTDEYNTRLSKKRADTVKHLMISYSRGINTKTTTLGKGFQENIKGLGTDDSRDAIDRRVEFKIVKCSNL